MAHKLKLSERLLRTSPGPEWMQWSPVGRCPLIPWNPEIPCLCVQLFTYNAYIIRKLNEKHGHASHRKVVPEVVKEQLRDDAITWKARFLSHHIKSLRDPGNSKPYERVDLIATVLCSRAVASLIGADFLEAEGIHAFAIELATKLQAHLIRWGKLRGHDFEGKISVYA